MSDGNTIANINPDLETEDMKLFDLFARASSAVVNASSLRKEVEIMKVDMSHLHETLATTNEAKSHLEGSLSRAHDTILELRDTKRQNELEIADQATTITRFNRELAELRERFAAMTYDRDQWCDASNLHREQRDSLQERYDDASEKLSTMRKVLGIPEPKATEPEVTQARLPLYSQTGPIVEETTNADFSKKAGEIGLSTELNEPSLEVEAAKSEVEHTWTDLNELTREDKDPSPIGYEAPNWANVPDRWEDRDHQNFAEGEKQYG